MTAMCVVFAAFGIGFLYLGWRLVRVLEQLVGLYAKYATALSPVRSSGQTSSVPDQIGQSHAEGNRSHTAKVPEIPPEAILRRAPKPAGFGKSQSDS